MTSTTLSRPPRSSARRARAARWDATSLGGHQRVLAGQRIAGQSCLIDMPAGDHGRVYLVERDVRSQDELKAIVAVYLGQSQRRNEPAIIARGENDLTRQLQRPEA